MHKESLWVNQIIKELNPEGFIAKTDINYKCFPEIFKSIEEDFKTRGLILEQLLIRNINLPASVKTTIESKQHFNNWRFQRHSG